MQTYIHFVSNLRHMPCAPPHKGAIKQRGGDRGTYRHVTICAASQTRRRGTVAYYGVLQRN